MLIQINLCNFQPQIVKENVLSSMLTALNVIKATCNSFGQYSKHINEFNFYYMRNYVIEELCVRL